MPYLLLRGWNWDKDVPTTVIYSRNWLVNMCSCCTVHFGHLYLRGRPQCPLHEAVKESLHRILADGFGSDISSHKRYRLFILLSGTTHTWYTHIGSTLRFYYKKKQQINKMKTCVYRLLRNGMITDNMYFS